MGRECSQRRGQRPDQVAAADAGLRGDLAFGERGTTREPRHSRRPAIASATSYPAAISSRMHGSAITACRTAVRCRARSSIRIGGRGSRSSMRVSTGTPRKSRLVVARRRGRRQRAQQLRLGPGEFDSGSYSSYVELTAQQGPRFQGLLEPTQVAVPIVLFGPTSGTSDTYTADLTRRANPGNRHHLTFGGSRCDGIASTSPSRRTPRSGRRRGVPRGQGKGESVREFRRRRAGREFDTTGAVFAPRLGVLMTRSPRTPSASPTTARTALRSAREFRRRDAPCRESADPASSTRS